MTEEISPCPACGGDVGPFVLRDGAQYVECPNSRCEMIGPWRTDKEAAIAEWNRLSAAAELAKAMRAQLELRADARCLRDEELVVGNVTVGMIRATGGES